MGNRPITLLMTLTNDERATLGWMLAEPEASGAREALLSLRAVRDVRVAAGGPVVQVDLVDVAGGGDSNDLIELRLRRWMHELTSLDATKPQKLLSRGPAEA